MTGKMALAMAFGLCLACNAHATHWQPIAPRAGGNSFVDVDSILHRGNLVGYWSRIEYDRAVKMQNHQTYTGLKTLGIANCSARTIRISYLATYNPAGQMVMLVRGDNVAMRVLPHTKGQALLNTLCKGATPDKAPLKAPQPAILKSVGNIHRYAPIIAAAATSNQLEKALLDAVIRAESGYRASVISPAGAIGLMQLMPETAKRFGVTNPFDPVQNIFGGAKYLSYLLRLFKNNLPLAIAAYNAGEKNVIKYGGRIPPFAETRGYVPKVLGFYHGTK